MFGDLTHVPDVELLIFFGLILARPGEPTAFDLAELEQIDEEMNRREQADARP